MREADTGCWQKLQKAPFMVSRIADMLETSRADATRLHEWMHRVITLLDTAVGQLDNQRHPAQRALLEAASLLRQQIGPPATGQIDHGRGRLLAWQARKVRDYIDAHITGPVLVADLCALIKRSEAHFSRSFKRTFGEAPHAFVVRRRLELAAQYMLDTDAALSDIAVRCGFTDQAHLCKHFRQSMGQTPALWRRGRRMQSLQGRLAVVISPAHGVPASSRWSNCIGTESVVAMDVLRDSGTGQKIPTSLACEIAPETVT
jgi:AraC family transcriptional regulator